MPRAKKVKLDMTGLRKFERSLGKGVTFTTGLFNKEQATKGYFLEYGEGTRQVPRPWLSSIFNPRSETRNSILALFKELVQDALRGHNTKLKTASQITSVVRDHLLGQKFEARPLTPYTRWLKREKGSATPDHIGLDGYDMVDSLKTKAKGGKRTR